MRPDSRDEIFAAAGDVDPVDVPLPLPHGRRDALGRRLSGRETDVLYLIAKGHSNEEIAERLLIGIETVKTHVRRILSRMNARNRAHAVFLAYELGCFSERRRTSSDEVEP